MKDLVKMSIKDCHKCEHYICWEFQDDKNEQPYPCESCKLQGQSYSIDCHKCPLVIEIKNKLKLAGFKTQKELAEYLGVSQNTVCKWIKNPSKLFMLYLDALINIEILREDKDALGRFVTRCIYEISDVKKAKNKEIADLQAKFEALDMLYKASKSNINEKVK